MHSISEFVYGLFNKAKEQVGDLASSEYSRNALAAKAAAQGIGSTFNPLTPLSAVPTKVSQFIFSTFVVLGWAKNICLHERIFNLLLLSMSGAEAGLILYLASEKIQCLPITSTIDFASLLGNYTSSGNFGGNYVFNNEYFDSTSDDFHGTCLAAAWLDLLYPVFLAALATLSCAHKQPEGTQQPEVTQQSFDEEMQNRPA